MKHCLLIVTLIAAFVANASTPFEARVEADFQKKREALTKGNLFSTLDKKLPTHERFALKFLYAYMPIGDITDYSGVFYLENIRSSYATRAVMPWGKSIPDDIFLHFVLPVRVNNENLDNSRIVFNQELASRVKNLSMEDAILEVNHWCHEKANYRPSDSRTSSPLATVKTAYGRCGEESTFLVAALRSIGIPARQVYTPRWAHTDDNHAWVEAWANGKWYFLGACEPEPVLNLGWFNAPASRGMLMHTKVFGYYEGPEDVMRTTPNYTEINVTSNYAKCAEATVAVIDSDGKPVANAAVEFKLYNYAEFYTVARKTTDNNGNASLTAGLGDMVAIAFKGNNFGMGKVTFGKGLTTITLNHTIGDRFSLSLDIVPPQESANIPPVTPRQRAINDLRFHQEDSIRNAYVATFPDSAAAAKFAIANNYGKQVEEVVEYIIQSRGNYAEIMSFLSTANRQGKNERALQLLSTLWEKDLRDTPAGILENHLNYTAGDADVETVLAPRIADEMITLYRSYLQKCFTKEEIESYRSNPQRLIDWCRNNLTRLDSLCNVNTRISPEGVWKSRATDEASCDIFFVAAARSLGIRSKIDPVTGNVVYWDNDGQEMVADFESGQSEISSTGKLQLTYSPIPRLNDPEYYRHYSLSKFNGKTFELLNYPDFEKWSELFQTPSDLETGYYLLVTGSRMANGSVLANAGFFNIEEGKTTNEALTMRNNDEQVRVIGSFNSESKFIKADTGEETSVLLTTGRGYFAVGVLGVGQEPTDHALKDIALKSAELEKWGRKMILLFPNSKDYEKYIAHPAAQLPGNVVFGIDNGNAIRNQILEEMKLPANTQMPLFIIADTFNRVVFESHGYTIGLGDQMLHTIDGL